MAADRKRGRSEVVIPVDPGPEASAREAGLRYVSDEEPGYRRKRWGRGFTYLDPDGEHVKDEDLRARFEALVIPPAWTDVWICPIPNGHLQATGRDDEGRKQYIYHPDWERVRNETKYNRMIPFGQALSEVRARCEHDLRRKGLPRDKVLAVVVSLLDRTLIRIGNRSYAQNNDSFGLSTLRDRHVDLTERRVTFEFRGKRGKQHSIVLSDRRLARMVRRCRDVPGYDLFQYYDEAGDRHAIDSGDVNTYLKETTGQPFTAKDFRTWGGTVEAATVLDAAGAAADEREAQAQVARMYEEVAARLGNTPAVCRQYYVHPALVDAYLDGSFGERWRRHLDAEPPPQLDPEEGATLLFLQDEVARA